MKRFIYILLHLILVGCHKGFLDERTSKSLVIPTKYEDYKALLSFTNDMNTGAFSSVVSDGEFIYTDAYITSTSIIVRNTYLWNADVYETQLFSPAWRLPFLQVMNANIVLEGIEQLDEKTVGLERLNALKGSALFFRAMAYVELVLNFTKPYQALNADVDLGLPIRTSSDVSRLEQRSTLKQTMDFILSDLIEATALLPDRQQFITDPNRAGAYALMSRVYLGMQDYEKALFYARECLKIQSELIDFNNVPISTPRTFPNPFVVPNPEIIFNQRSNQSAQANSTAFQVRQDVLDMYASNDLRKTRYFNANRNFIGNYNGTTILYSGLTTDEVWLTVAECEVRLNRSNDALEALNMLCKNRYNNASFVPYSSQDSEEILVWTLQERRKELITRTGWFDLRRLNIDSRFARTLTRTYNGETYTLQPNSSRYVFAIPAEEINETGMEQNIRINND
ncbi:RagB/SusD family nutrient uptake outer membrane protein [Sphingobacterium alkalisoli]|uniref:RagB/SusD family nutrient uptake outer membrane protein n=1 Tax=Sphingobacterium alkalisoli TaxID=1874115 RepID=A0A4U0GX76_9SPHI|nr:RagB/SusD family nutrient uptake outer membrane protein [Sphingobacterium alkalisoli]TJY63723.1 RagB/SusD family nutrient uptake outer membrane protein [Sphingobacterium alkalisoli]GGH25288.1 hypothetical protein GCM10011418_33810 [Sphingobacterium alkalisoli]